MRYRAVEILFRYKLLILLPVVVITMIAAAAAARPQPVTWQTYTRIWVDQYKLLYQDDRLGFTPASSQAALFNDYLGTRTFALGVAQETRLAALLEKPDGDLEAMYEVWNSVRVWATSNNFITVQVTTENPE